MRLGIVGLDGAGKKTVFDALNQTKSEVTGKGDGRLATINVPDERIDALSKIYNPKKTIYAQVSFWLPEVVRKDANKDPNLWQPVRDCDALLHVVRNFRQYGTEVATPAQDIRKLEQEMVFSDFVTVEKRLERMEAEQKRGKKPNEEEQVLLLRAKELLENEIPLRNDAEISTSPLLRGFAFISAKPVLILCNNEDEDEDETFPAMEISADVSCKVIRAKLEEEISQMTEEEAAVFLDEFGIAESAVGRILHAAYELLGRMSFFTVGEDEVRAWTIPVNTMAVDAAEAIHSDIKKGFIRAEVLAYDDLMAAGSYANARTKGTVRLEGKTYEVQDGDIINFRFNV